jgi:hypothetical protein
MPNPEVEAEIGRDLALAVTRCRAFFGCALQGLYLGGSYGRGEGGIRLEDGHWRPESDYDLFALVRGGDAEARGWRWRSARRLLPELQRGQRMEYELGILGERSLLRQAPSQRLYDLRQGHRVLWGDPEALLELPCEDASSLPPAEGLELLVNRGALLLLAAHALAGGEDLPAVRLDRLLHKARLAVGDAWLLLQRQHHHQLVVRAKHVAFLPLLDLPSPARWRKRHAEAAATRLSGFSQDVEWPQLRAELELLLGDYREAVLAALHRCDREHSRWLRRRADVVELARALTRVLGHQPRLPEVGLRADDFLVRWRAGAA